MGLWELVVHPEGKQASAFAANKIALQRDGVG